MTPRKSSDRPPKINTTESLPVRTQFLIFTLFGEFVMERHGTIWTSCLLELMELLGMSERAVRSTLSRMNRKGWIKSKKQGRRSQYYVTSKGQALFESGRQRIFEPIISDWDGRWHLVVYSLPEKKRRERHTLRKQLTWLGFGVLAPGTWISPHERRAELDSLYAQLDIEPNVDLFSGVYLGPSSAQDLVKRCWDLEGLKAQYDDFISHYEKEYQECLDRATGDGKPPLEPKDCFVRNFWLTHEFQSFPLIDPNLPTDLLPADWVGFAARRLFDDYHKLLKVYANQFVDALTNGIDDSNPHPG